MSDFDGDIVMTTEQEEFIKGASFGLPITYGSKKVDKTTISDEKLIRADMDAFYTKIGFITNCSTTLYSMLPHYEGLQKEEIINRLKICRKEQGSQIDKSKGLIVKPFPLHWTRWTRVTDDMDEETRSVVEFRNSVLIDKRPYFMRYLYTNYNKDFRKFKDGYNTYCIANFGVELDDLLTKTFKEETLEHVFLDKYKRFKPLIDSDCTMNNICHHMEEKIQEIKANRNIRTPDEVIALLKDTNISIDKIKLKKMYDLYKEYKFSKQNFAILSADNSDSKFKTIQQFEKYIRKKSAAISSDMCELANLAVVICYELYPGDNKGFAWKVFGDGIVENVKKNKQKKCSVPFLDKNGDITYLSDNYSMMEIDVFGGTEDFYDYI